MPLMVVYLCMNESRQSVSLLIKSLNTFIYRHASCRELITGIGELTHVLSCSSFLFTGIHTSYLYFAVCNHFDDGLQSADSKPWWKANFFISEPVLFGTWDGVFTSCMINIFGVIIFLRTGWMVVGYCS